MVDKKWRGKEWWWRNGEEKNGGGVRHVTGTGSGLLGEIPRVVVQISALT
jgi:hypothetical protein